MPRLREFTSSETLRPTTRGAPDIAQRVAGAGAISGAISEGFSQLKQEVDTIVRINETSELAKEFANAQAELTTGWLETARSADPNDPETATRYMEEVVRPRLDAIGEKTRTPAGRGLFERTRAGLEANLFQRTQIDQAELAGVAASQNLATSVNQLTTASFEDPTTFDINLSMLDIAVEGAVQTGLDRGTALKARTVAANELARATVLGVMQNDAKAGLTLLSTGKFDEFIDGTTRNALQNTGEQMLRGEDAAAIAQQAEAERQRRLVSEGARTEFMQTLLTPAGGVNLPEDFAKQVLSDDRLTASDQSVLFNVYRALTADAASGGSKTNPALFNALFARALLPKGDPNRLGIEELGSHVGHGITAADFNSINARITGAGDPRKEIENNLMAQTFDNVRAHLGATKNPITGAVSPLGSDAFTRFNAWFQQEYALAIRGGKTPTQLLDPRSPDYLAHADTLELFKPTLDQSISEMYEELDKLGAAFERSRIERENGEQPRQTIDEFFSGP